MNPTRLLLALCVCVWAAMLAIAQAPATRDANAADVYRQAFAAMDLDDEARDAVNEAADGGPMTEATARAVADNTEALGLLREGAKVGPVDWGLDLTQGFDAELPWLSEARQLASLAAAAVRVDGADATGFVGSSLALARHVGSDPVVVSKMVQMQIEGQTADAAAAALPHMTDGQLRSLAGFLDARPADESIPSTIRAEGRSMADYFQTLPQFPNKLFVDLDGEPKNMTLWQRARWTDAEQRKIWTDGYAEVHADLADAAASPRDRRDANLAAVYDKLPAYGPLATLLTGSYKRALLTRDLADAKLALLRAAVDVQLDGEAALFRHDKPILGGAPVLARDADGYTLMSKSTFAGEPATLIVGG